MILLQLEPVTGSFVTCSAELGPASPSTSWALQTRFRVTLGRQVFLSCPGMFFQLSSLGLEGDLFWSSKDSQASAVSPPTPQGALRPFLPLTDPACPSPASHRRFSSRARHAACSDVCSVLHHWLQLLAPLVWTPISVQLGHRSGWAGSCGHWGQK